MHTLIVTRDTNGNKRIQCKNNNGQSFSIQRPVSRPCIGMGKITDKETNESEFQRLYTYIGKHGTTRQKQSLKMRYGVNKIQKHIDKLNN